MSRGLLACLVLSALTSGRVFAAEDPFEAERRAALAQVAWVEQAYAERLGPHGTEWRARVQKEEPALAKTLDWFARTAAGDQALRLAVPLAYFWNYEGRASESRALLTRILALPSAAAPTAIRAKALYDAGTLAFGERDHSAARTLDEESLRIYRRVQDQGGTATALLGLSRIALREMDYASARRYAEESGVLRRDLGDKVGQAGAIHMLAAVARIQGQYDKSAELYQFSLDANREAGWDLPVAAELFNLGYVRLRQGNVDASRKLFTESLQKYRELQDEAGVAYVLTGFASLAVEQKQATRAARLYASALGLLDRFNVVFDPDDQLDIDHYTAMLLTLLPPAAFKAASADGQKISPERAIALALETPLKVDLDIVFEDRLLIVVNKPAGLLSVPLPRKAGAPSVYDRLERYLRPQHRRPFVVHRIDRDTSGLVMFAKDPRTQEALKRQFIRRDPERVYLAVVYGHPHPKTGTWRDHLVWDRKALIQKRTHPRDPQGAEAVSHYRVVEELGDAALIEVRLETGKRNQIRIQARLRGHTLVGERRYVYGPETLRPVDFPRQALHAYSLAFRHPVDHREMRFEAPLPRDLRELLARLRAS